MISPASCRHLSIEVEYRRFRGGHFCSIPCFDVGVKEIEGWTTRLLPSRLKEVRLSAHVDQQALLKLLDYVYFGYVEAGEDVARKLKTLAKFCNLKPLFLMLCRKIPKWGTPIPSSNLTHALGPVGDVILEAKAAEKLPWACGFCSLLEPHMHAHEIIHAYTGEGLLERFDWLVHDIASYIYMLD
ncbi:hypothetical protein COLO4_20820 [Corchorus olitorius]|uniref:BTB domain-containing protein n=1 Tax=Corchorus olitorius TaxID=93759 RepID=A0A1R3IWT1_9ROSI|nr:hypothetical protein COLO4_20820 [Corchorus olitorius]